MASIPPIPSSGREGPSGAHGLAARVAADHERAEAEQHLGKRVLKGGNPDWVVCSCGNFEGYEAWFRDHLIEHFGEAEADVLLTFRRWRHAVAEAERTEAEYNKAVERAAAADRPMRRTSRGGAFLAAEVADEIERLNARDAAESDDDC